MKSAYTMITPSDSAYPESLRHINQPPKQLYVLGDVQLLQLPQLAIVGSRNPSLYGKTQATAFAAAAAAMGWVITSGMAMGIDAYAHQAALSVGRSIAVLGCGVDVIYPKRNQQLYQDLLTQGCIISEFAPGTAPRAQHFPMRNRIITGLALGTLVVEATLKSGSLISARYAMEQNREVFAIPGSINNPLARGPHQLIQQGAKLVETIDDIIVELPAIAVTQQQANVVDDKKSHKNNDKRLVDEHKKLLEYIGHERIDLETLIAISGFSAEQAKNLLLELELFGHIKYEFGQYERVWT